jgi:2-alkyl-3-oxoalkanoate reductase
VTVLVTGASGMLGRAVAELLAARGDTVRVFQRRPAGIPGVEEILGDLRDPAAVRAAVDGTGAVVHLAAQVSVTGRWRTFAAVNIGGVRHLLDAIRAAGVPKLVHVSSPSVAHQGSSLAGTGAGPADPRRARGNYARSKAAGELLALAADQPGLAVAVVRPHLVWGPGDTQLIGRIVARARAGRLAVVGPGTGLIDTTYVDNATEAIVAALDRATQARGEPLVVTNGQPRPVAELLGQVCVAAGARPPRRHVPYRLAWTAGLVVESAWPAGEPPITRFLAEQLGTAHWFDQRRTRRLLHWTPRVDLDEGLARLAGWYSAVPR